MKDCYRQVRGRYFIRVHLTLRNTIRNCTPTLTVIRIPLLKHLVLSIKTIPHKVRDEYEYEIFKYHSKKCDFYYSQKPGREFYDEINRTFRKPVCSCSLRTTQQSVLMGTCHIVNIVPEHNIITGQQVLCHQAVIHSGSVHSDASLYTKKRTPGTTLTFVARIEPPHLFYGDLP